MDLIQAFIFFFIKGFLLGHSGAEATINFMQYMRVKWMPFCDILTHLGVVLSASDLVLITRDDESYLQRLITRDVESYHQRLSVMEKGIVYVQREWNLKHDFAVALSLIPAVWTSLRTAASFVHSFGAFRWTVSFAKNIFWKCVGPTVCSFVFYPSVQA